MKGLPIEAWSYLQEWDPIYHSTFRHGSGWPCCFAFFIFFPYELVKSELRGGRMKRRRCWGTARFLTIGHWVRYLDWGQQVHQPGSEIPEASSYGCTVNHRSLVMVVVVEGGGGHGDGGGAGSPTPSGNCSGKFQRALLKLTGWLHFEAFHTQMGLAREVTTIHRERILPKMVKSRDVYYFYSPRVLPILHSIGIRVR